jgi:hypothetical protein
MSSHSCHSNNIVFRYAVTTLTVSRGDFDSANDLRFLQRTYEAKVRKSRFLLPFFTHPFEREL